MSKLTEGQKNLLLLYGRSKHDEHGWATVSAMVWPLVEAHATKEMFEVEKSENGGRVRTTPAGSIVLEFAL